MVYILGELGDPRALDALETVIAEDDPYLASEAAKATGKIGGPRALEILQNAMPHSSFMVRGEVALALGSMAHEKRDYPLEQQMLEQKISDLLDQLLDDVSSYVASCAGIALEFNNIHKKTK